MNNYKKISDFIIKNKIMVMIAVSIAALFIRLKFISLAGGDYDGFLSEWCSYLKSNGGFRAISSVKTDYNAIYLYFLALFSYIPIKDLYLIKILSFIFDYVLAFGGYKLIKSVTEKNSEILALTGYTSLLLMPTVIMNSAEWVQCDSIYAAFLLWSLYFMIEKKYDKSFILYGIAISFKLQAIFLLPAYGIIFLKNKEFSVFKFLWIPVINILLYVPAILLGKPVSSVFDAYFTQVGHYSYKTVLGYPNIYYFFDIDNVSLIKPGICFTMFLLFLLLILVIRTKGKLDNIQIIELSMAVLFLVTYFLPEMHDRYGYVAEVLSVVYFLMIKRHYAMWLLINVNSSIAYGSFLHGIPEGILVKVALLQFIVVFYFTFTFMVKRVNKNCYRDLQLYYNNIVAECERII